jgi:hypothetical protein
MESFIVIAILVTIVSAYLLRQFWAQSLQVDDAPSGNLAPPDAEGGRELRAA